MTKSPTIRLLLGLLITLAAVTGSSLYSFRQLGVLRRLQTQTIDLNRHDSLLLLRVQNGVNTLGLKLQEMTEGKPAAPIADYQYEFERLRRDLNSAMRADNEIAPVSRNPSTRMELADSLQKFWSAWDTICQEASAGKEALARKHAASRLSNEQIVLARRLGELLEANNEAEARADVKVAAIYDGAERQTYLFLIATMAAILFTSSYVIYSNRKIFERLEVLSRQRRVLAARLITVQEEVLRSVSRELHDEFGQILTAVSAMLSRAERKGVPPDSPLRTELAEVREITHNTLEKMRSLSQMLHPAILDDYGLAKGVEWYTGVFTRQTGIQATTVVEGEPVLITGQTATHCFRIVQEALTNAAKHSGAASAKVLLRFSDETLTISIQDFGRGLPPRNKSSKPGLGVIAMRERAAILHGKFDISSAANAGTTVSLVLPFGVEEDSSELDESEEFGEVVTR